MEYSLVPLIIDPEKILSALANLRNQTDWLRESYVNAGLAGMPAAYITSLTITVSKYAFRGDTACEPNDPRLFMETDSGSVYYNDNSGVSWTSAFSPVDPCGGGLGTTPTRTFTQQ